MSRLSQAMTMMISDSSLARASLLAGFDLDKLTQGRGLLRDEWTGLSHYMADAFDKGEEPFGWTETGEGELLAR